MTNATIEQEIAAVKRWQRDPDYYVRENIGARLLKFQSDVLRSVRDNKRTLVVTAPGTGKTTVAAATVLWFTVVNCGAHTITTAPTWDHLEKKLWPQIAAMHRDAKAPIGGEMSGTKLQLDVDWMAYAISTDRPTAFGGTHKKKMLVVFDDAHGVSDEIWKITEDNLMAGHGAHWLAIGNPLYSEGPFYHASLPGSGWNVIHFSALDHPNVIERREVVPGAVTHEKVDKIIARYGVDSAEYAREVKGEFAVSVTSALISRAMLAACATIAPTVKEDAHLGIDVSEGGADKTVCSLVKDRVLVEQVEWTGDDPMVNTGKIFNLIRELNVAQENVHIDMGGGGSAVVARLGELGLSVDGVWFGGEARNAMDTAVSGEKYANMRAEMYATVAQLLRDKALSIPDKYESTWIDLCQPEWDPKIRSDGARHLKPKEQIKKRIGRSPDYGDSLVLALARSPSFFVESF